MDKVCFTFCRNISQQLLGDRERTGRAAKSDLFQGGKKS